MEKLIIKIAVFSLLYTFPAALHIGAQFYESWWRDAASKKVYVNEIIFDQLLTPIIIYIFQALCNCDIQESHFSETELQVILLRYSMHLIPGLGSGIWICTPKTFKIWSRVFPCKRKIQRRYVIIVKKLYQTQPKFVIRLYYLLKILQSLLEILLVKEKYILDLMEYLRSL